MSLTTVEFKFVLPNGTPLAGALFTIHLSKSGYDDDHSGILMPRALDVTTDDQGMALVDLWPTDKMYYVVMEDPESEKAIHYKFLIQDQEVPGGIVRLQDVVVNCEVSGTTYDEAALLIIQGAKINAVAAARSAAESLAALIDVGTDAQEARDQAVVAATVATEAQLAASGFADTASSAAQAANEDAQHAELVAGTVGVKSANVDVNGDLILVRNNDSVLNAGHVHGDQGEQGVQGLIGLTGAKGDQGIQGIQGVQGDKGDKGDTGNTGLQGIQGLKGDTGDQGPKGDTGDEGPKGDSGAGLKVLGSLPTTGDLPASGNEDGDAYLIGSNVYIWGGTAWTDAGPLQGPEGPQGNQGIKGDTGEQGIQGVKGDTGEQGLQGDIGLQGVQGIKGDTGDVGPKGDTGDQGIQGIQGETGLTGDTGPKGDTGDQGPQGIQGAPGNSDVDALAITYNLDGTIDTVTEDGVEKTFTYSGDGTIDTVSWPVGALTRTETYSYTDGVLTSMTATEA